MQEVFERVTVVPASTRTTTVAVWRVRADRQAPLVCAVAAQLIALSDCSGPVGVALFASRDLTRVTAFVQWSSEQHAGSFLVSRQREAMDSTADQFGAKGAFRAYRLLTVRGREQHPPTFVPGCTDGAAVMEVRPTGRQTDRDVRRVLASAERLARRARSGYATRFLTSDAGDQLTIVPCTPEAGSAVRWRLLLLGLTARRWIDHSTVRFYRQVDLVQLRRWAPVSAL